MGKIDPGADIDLGGVALSAAARLGLRRSGSGQQQGDGMIRTVGLVSLIAATGLITVILFSPRTCKPSETQRVAFQVICR